MHICVETCSLVHICVKTCGLMHIRVETCSLMHVETICQIHFVSTCKIGIQHTGTLEFAVY